jgi:hypothetical protein
MLHPTTAWIDTGTRFVAAATLASSATEARV